MGNFLLRIAANSLGLYVAAWLVPGFSVNGGWKEYILAGLVLALLNMLVKPILKLISLPLIVVTLGLFSVVINMAILWTVASFFSFIVIGSLTALFLATFVLSLVNVLTSHAS